MTKLQFVATTAAAALLLSTSACKMPGDSADAIEKVDSVAMAESVKADMADVIKAFNEKDAAKVTIYNAPDYVAMFHGAPNVISRQANLDANKRLLADPLAHIVVSDETVDVAASGDLAVYRATYSYTFSDPVTKAPANESGNWLVGFKTQPDGSRKSIWAVVSDTKAAPPPPAP